MMINIHDIKLAVTQEESSSSRKASKGAKKRLQKNLVWRIRNLSFEYILYLHCKYTNNINSF